MLELVAIAELNVQSAVDRGMPRDLLVPDAAAVIRRRRAQTGSPEARHMRSESQPQKK